MKNKKVITANVLLILLFPAPKVLEDQKEIIEESNSDINEDVSTMLVNVPPSKDVVVFSTNEYDYVRALIQTTDYKKQQEKALHIVSIYKDIEMRDVKLYEDFLRQKSNRYR